jgi:hypothetical protein
LGKIEKEKAAPPAGFIVAIRGRKPEKAAPPAGFIVAIRGRKYNKNGNLEALLWRRLINYQSLRDCYKLRQGSEVLKKKN